MPTSATDLATQFNLLEQLPDVVAIWEDDSALIVLVKQADAARRTELRALCPGTGIDVIPAQDFPDLATADNDRIIGYITKQIGRAIGGSRKFAVHLNCCWLVFEHTSEQEEHWYLTLRLVNANPQGELAAPETSTPPTPDVAAVAPLAFLVKQAFPSAAVAIEADAGMIEIELAHSVEDIAGFELTK